MLPDNALNRAKDSKTCKVPEIPPISRAIPEIPISPKGLYIHIPFCASRCPYCDFYVIVSRSGQECDKEHWQFVHRVVQQLDTYLEQKPLLLQKLESIFLGGGTPSLLGAAALRYLLEQLEQRLRRCGHLGFGGLRELSMESNPELISKENLQLWQGLGISRLSIGLQSHSDALLKYLGRRSSSSLHMQLAAMLPRYFGGEYSFDFLYGIPGQSLTDIQGSLDFIKSSVPHHVSYYELSIEEDSWFGKKALRLKTDEQTDEQFVRLCDGLQNLGYERYEVSNFANNVGNQERNGRRSHHNQLYWRWQPYLGLGPSAVGAALLPVSKNEDSQMSQASITKAAARVWRMQCAPNRYLQQPDFGLECAWLSEAESIWEYLLMALRLRRGIDVCEWASLFLGWEYQAYAADKMNIGGQNSKQKQAAQNAKMMMEQWLQQNLPQSIEAWQKFFLWKEEAEKIYLQLSPQGFDLQGSFLRSAYRELGL